MNSLDGMVRVSRTGVSVRAAQPPGGGPAVKSRTYEPCFSNTFSAFLAATFSLR
jgi:hypothetical protein